MNKVSLPFMKFTLSIITVLHSSFQTQILNMEFPWLCYKKIAASYKSRELEYLQLFITRTFPNAKDFSTDEILWQIVLVLLLRQVFNIYETALDTHIIMCIFPINHCGWTGLLVPTCRHSQGVALAKARGDEFYNFMAAIQI